MIDRRKFIKSISALGISLPLVKSNLKAEKKSTAKLPRVYSLRRLLQSVTGIKNPPDVKNLRLGFWGPPWFCVKNLSPEHERGTT